MSATAMKAVADLDEALNELRVMPVEAPPVGAAATLEAGGDTPVAAVAQKAPIPVEKLDALSDDAGAKLTADTEDDLRQIGKYTLWAFTTVAVIVMFLTARGKSGDFGDWDQWSPARRSLLVTTGVTILMIWSLALLRRSHGGIRAMFRGTDKRFSTSATQVILWTFVLAYTIMFLCLQLPLGLKNSAFASSFDQLDEAYLLLLGGPFAAAVIAGAVTSTRVANGTLQKVTATQAGPSDVLSDDDSNTDVVDTQYLLFNFVALVYFVAVFCQHPTRLPDLPDGLVGLTSLAALGYVGAKVATRNAPILTSITKYQGSGSIRPGDRVVLWGENLIPAGARKGPVELARIRVQFGDQTAIAIPAEGGTSNGSDRLLTQVPAEMTPPTCDVTVTTAAGAQSAPYHLTITPDVPLIRGAAPLPIVPGKELVLTGMFFQRVGNPGPATVWFDGVSREASATSDEHVTVTAPPLTSATTSVSVLAHDAVTPSAPTVLPVDPA